MSLVYERAWSFPKTYKENFIIEDFLIEQYFKGHYQNLKEKRNKKQFKFDDVFFEYVNGNKEKFRRKWMDMEYVYYVVNVNDNHWFLCQICLTF